MTNNKSTKKSQQLGSILLIIALITAFFAVGLYTSGNGITGAAVGLEIVTGMAGGEGGFAFEYDGRNFFFPIDTGIIFSDKTFFTNLWLNPENLQTFRVREDGLHYFTGDGNELTGDKAETVFLKTLNSKQFDGNALTQIRVYDRQNQHRVIEVDEGSLIDLPSEFLLPPELVAGDTLEPVAESPKLEPTPATSPITTLNTLVNTALDLKNGDKVESLQTGNIFEVRDGKWAQIGGDSIVTQGDLDYLNDLRNYEVETRRFTIHRANIGVETDTNRDVDAQSSFTILTDNNKNEFGITDKDLEILNGGGGVSVGRVGVEESDATDTGSTITIISNEKKDNFALIVSGQPVRDVEGNLKVFSSIDDAQNAKIIESTRVKLFDSLPQQIQKEIGNHKNIIFGNYEGTNTYVLDISPGVTYDTFSEKRTEIKTEIVGDQEVTTTKIDSYRSGFQETTVEVKEKETPDKEVYRKLISKTKTEITTEFDKGSKTKTTFRTVTTFEVINGKETGKWTSIKYNDLGKPIRIDKDNGNSAWVEGGEIRYEGDPQLASQLQLLVAQYTSRKWFAIADSLLTSYSGLGYYATLFFDDEDLSQWKESVDQAFATLYLGTEYWESEICSLSIDRDQQGVAYIDTRLGLAAVAAHIEATRSPSIILPPSEGGGREFLYKITFNVKNGEYDKDPKALEVMRFNVILKGERTARLFGNDIEVKRGNEFEVLGNEAIVQFSNFFYDEVCIKFDDVPSFWTLDDDELCNTIIGAPSSGQPIGSSSGEGTQESQGDNVLDI